MKNKVTNVIRTFSKDTNYIAVYIIGLDCNLFLHLLYLVTEFPLISPQGANLIFRVKAVGAKKRGRGLKRGAGVG